MPKGHLRQLTFNDQSFTKPKDIFGGSLLTSNPKTKRPLSTAFPIHLSLKSNYRNLRIPKNFKGIHQIIYKTAKRYGIKVYSYANVGNHLHLLIKLSKIRLWAAFIRELTSQIAQIVTDNQKKRAQSLKLTAQPSEMKLNHSNSIALVSEKSLVDGKHLPGISESVILEDDVYGIGTDENKKAKNLTPSKKFWKYRPFTRIIRSWNKAFLTVKNYIYLNKIEAEGHIKRSDVKTLRDLRELIFDG